MNKQWWGSFDAQIDAGLQWRVGPLDIVGMRRQDSWQIATRSRSDPFDASLEHAPAGALPDDPTYNITRYGVAGGDATLHLEPSLADRPVVAKPENTFVVPPGAQMGFYIGMALWIRFRVGGERLLVGEAAISRPPDTWFGATTVEGEVCYASRTTLRTQLASLPLRFHRCVTPVSIQNETSEPMVLARMRLPAPSLSLYRDTDGRLWTQRVELVRETVETKDLATIRIAKGSPRIAKGAELITGPRVESSGQALMHMMSSFLQL